MLIRSLAYRTDLALRRLGGSEVEDRGEYVVIRSPHNPSHWWGNFLLLSGPPAGEQVDHWLEVFRREFPDASHVALGVDGTEDSVDVLSPLAARGFEVNGDAVMTATAVHEPPRPNRDATYRPLAGDDDWEQLVDLRMACIGEGLDPADYHEFVTAQVDTARRLTEAGHGAWFGAFGSGRLLAGMGLFRADDALARFQSVETRPEARGRGLAGTLVHQVSRFGFEELGARTLVMVADPDYLAIRIYRSVGFAETETQLGAERRPASDTDS